MTLEQRLARMERRLAAIERALDDLAHPVRLNGLIVAYHARGMTDKEIALELEAVTGKTFSAEAIRHRRRRG